MRKIPWLTTGAITFLEKYLAEEARSILEFGSGASTLWFLPRVGEIVSVEHNGIYYETMKLHLENDSKLTYILETNIGEDGESCYSKVIDDMDDDRFDLALIDGRDRIECAIKAKRVVKPGGFIMLDNAERVCYQPIFEALSDWKLVEDVQKGPDETGFFYTNWTTTWWQKPA